MSKKTSTDILVAPDRIQQMVHIVRGQRVMLDFDLARLYGVPTSALNQACGGTPIGSRRILRISLPSKSLQT